MAENDYRDKPTSHISAPEINCQLSHEKNCKKKKKNWKYNYTCIFSLISHKYILCITSIYSQSKRFTGISFQRTCAELQLCIHTLFLVTDSWSHITAALDL